MWYVWQSHNILSIDWIVWWPTFLKFCKITALSTFLIMSKSSNVFFLLGLIFHPKDFFYFFKINVANITEWWKRQLKCPSQFTINKMEFRNCVVFFFACCILKVWCCGDIAMHVRLLNTKYTLFTAFHTLIR
jgi:hypothetical protein